MKVGRNDPCHCGSGLKYKKCHLPKDEAAHAAELVAQRAAAAAATAAADAADAAEADAPSESGAPRAPRVAAPPAAPRAKPQVTRQPGAARRRAV